MFGYDKANARFQEYFKDKDEVETNKIWMKSDVETYAEDIGRKIHNYLK